MDESSLREVCVRGLESAPATRDLEGWCWDRAEATGDARYCGFARMFSQAAEIWDDYGALPAAVIQEINDALRRHLPGAIEAPTAEEGAGLARLLREEVATIVHTWGGRF